MFGCRIFCSTAISWASPSSSFFPSREVLISFTATVWPVCRCSARHTTAKLPWPTVCRSTHSPVRPRSTFCAARGWWGSGDGVPASSPGAEDEAPGRCGPPGPAGPGPPGGAARGSGARGTGSGSGGSAAAPGSGGPGPGGGPAPPWGAGPPPMGGLPEERHGHSTFGVLP